METTEIENNIISDVIENTPHIDWSYVTCRICGKRVDVDPRRAFKKGWPKCCGYTMTIDNI